MFRWHETKSECLITQFLNPFFNKWRQMIVYRNEFENRKYLSESTQEFRYIGSDREHRTINSFATNQSG